MKRTPQETQEYLKILRAERRELLSRHSVQEHRCNRASQRMERYEERLGKISDTIKKLGYDR